MFFAPVNKGLTFTKTNSGKNLDYRMCLIWLLLKIAKKGLHLFKAKHMPLWYSGRYVIDILKIVQFVKNFQKFAHMFRRVRHSQKSPATKYWTTGSAIYRSLKMADTSKQEYIILGL